MDSQQDLSRSMLKKKLRDQAAASGGQPIGIYEHLGRDITQAEVDAYAQHDLRPTDQAYGPAGLARTLERALEPMTWSSPFVRRAVRSRSFFLTRGWSVRKARTACAANATSVSTHKPP